MSEWKLITLGEICQKVMTGGTPLSNNEDFYKDGNIPWLKTKEVNFCRIRETESHISELGLANSSARIVPANSVIIAMYGQGDTAGRVAINELPLTTNQACCNLVIDSKVADYNFVYFYLKNSYRELVNAKTGSAQPNLNTRIVKEFPITLPPLQEQKGIAAILVCFDRKIENLRKQNETLEAIAQTLFKHWFIDFEFPNADGKPYKSSGGAMEPSELGEIPIGWHVGGMDDVIEVRDGTHDSPKQTDEGFHLVTSKHLKKEGIDFKSAYLISKSDYIEVNKRSKVETYDILLSMIGTVGLLYFVMDKEIEFAIKNIGLFKASQNLDFAEYIFLFLSSDYGKTYFRTRLAGTTQSYLTLGSLRGMPLIVPVQMTLLEFKQIAQSLFEKTHTNNQQMHTLTRARDVLLPKLMSGKLRINP